MAGVPADLVDSELGGRLDKVAAWDYPLEATIDAKGLDAVSDVAWDLVITLCDRIKETCPTLPGQPVSV